MESAVQISQSNTVQIRHAVSEILQCQPERTCHGLIWTPKGRAGISSAALHPAVQQRQELEVVLATVPETVKLALKHTWDLVAQLIKETEFTAGPIPPAQDDTSGRWQITARLNLKDEPLDLPRLSRLNAAFEALDRCAEALKAGLPPTSICVAPDVPRELKGLVQLLTPTFSQDSDIGNVSEAIRIRLEAGVPVAVVGTPLRVRLELNRLARATPNIAVVQDPTLIQKVPQMTRVAKRAGLVLAIQCSLLRPRMSLYEQGRELEGTLQELSANGLPLLTFGTREEHERIFGIGQGRSYSPLQPVIETLAPTETADLVRTALLEHDAGPAPKDTEQLLQQVLNTAAVYGTGREDLLQPLSKLAAERGTSDPGLLTALALLAQDLTARSDTFGTCDEAPAAPRPAHVDRHLQQHLGRIDLKDLLASKILGQEAAVAELAERLWEQVIATPDTQPLRLMLAGPVGTGKSMVAKLIADLLHWLHYYIDATAFDSPHAVMTSLAGASPGVVNSYDDGVLARIARSPAVVEVADLDHAQPGVRGALCDFFLRVLQEGTLQTGSGAIIRTIPSVIFIFTSNVAYGSHKASARFGFGDHFTRREIQEQVVSCAREHLGHAFISRVGQPIIFDEFTRETAEKLVLMETKALVGRRIGAKKVQASPRFVEHILASLPTLESGARGVTSAIQAALAQPLRHCQGWRVEYVHVGVRGSRVVITKAKTRTVQGRMLKPDTEGARTE